MRRLLVAAIALLPVVSAASIGQVYRTGGNIDLTREGRALTAVAGSPVEVGDAYSTRPAQQAAFQMRDDAVMSLSASSHFEVLSYQFESQDPAGNHARYRLASGGARLISGLIAKQRPGSVVLETPSGEITTLGTDYAVVNCSSCQAPGLYMAVNSGAVTFVNGAGSATVSAGQIVFVAGPSTAPVLIDKLPPEVVLAPDPSLLLLSTELADGNVRIEVVQRVEITDPICDEPSSPVEPECQASR